MLPGTYARSERDDKIRRSRIPERLSTGHRESEQVRTAKNWNMENGPWDSMANETRNPRNRRRKDLARPALHCPDIVSMFQPPAYNRDNLLY